VSACVILSVIDARRHVGSRLLPDVVMPADVARLRRRCRRRHYINATTPVIDCHLLPRAVDFFTLFAVLSVVSAQPALIQYAIATFADFA